MFESSFFSSFFSDPDICSESHVQTFPARTQIFQQGGGADTLYVIELGSVKLSVMALNGREIIVGIRRRNELMGTTPILLGRPHAYTVTTLVRSSMRCVPAKVFLNLVQTNKVLSWQLNLFLCREIIRQRERVEAYSCLPARESLEYFLRELIIQQEGEELQTKAEFCVPFNNQDLAEIIAVTPEHPCRLLKKIEKDGIIRRDKGMLVVSNVNALLDKTEC